MPQYSDIGKAPKDLFNGSPKSGAFQLEPKLTFASSANVDVIKMGFAVNALKKADKVDGTLKITSAYANMTSDVTISPSGSIVVGAAAANVLPSLAPGLKLTLGGVVPNPSSGKLGLDYVPCKELALKAGVTLVSAPTVDVSGAYAVSGFLLGGEAAYDTAKSVLTKYNVALGYHDADYQVAVHLLNKLSTVKVAYSHQVSSTNTLGCEVSRPVAGGDTTFTLGYAKKLGNGSLMKLKLDQAGALTTMYETKLASGEKVAAALQVATTDLSKAPKYGFSLDLS